MGGSKKQTVGYRYYFGIHMGIGRGPIDALKEIKVGDRTAWTGNVTENSTVSINAASLFGGDEKEGGIQGPLEVMMGGPTQVASGGLQAMLGSPQPGYRGVVTAFFNGLISSNNPYPKPWKFRINRIFAGWDRVGGGWYPEKAPIPIGSDGLPNTLEPVNATMMFSTGSGGVISGQIERSIALNAVGATGNTYISIFVVNPATASGGVRLYAEIDGARIWSTTYPGTVGVRIFHREQINTPSSGAVLTLGFEPVGGPFSTPQWSLDLAGIPGTTVWSPVSNLETTPSSASDFGVVTDGAGNYRYATYNIGDGSGNIWGVSTWEREPVGVLSMNPAHIIYECLTNRQWGRGLAPERLDEASFTEAADTLFAEGLGLCIKWTRRDSIETFVQSILDHIGATLFVSRSTALMTLRLIRADYLLNDLPLFDSESGLLEIRDASVGSTGKSVNGVTVTYHEPLSDEDRTVSVTNPASLLAAGGVSNTVSKEYKGLPSAALAARVAQRDLRAASANLRRFTLVLDRRAEDVEPGGVIAIQDLKRGIPKMAVRVGRVEDGTLTDGRITLQVGQDVFSLPATSFAAEVGNQWTPPNTTPCVPTDQRVIEAPYFLLAGNLSAADLSFVGEDGGYMAVLSARGQALNIGYQINVRSGAPTVDDNPINTSYVCET